MHYDNGKRRAPSVRAAHIYGENEAGSLFQYGIAAHVPGKRHSVYRMSIWGVVSIFLSEC